MGLPFFDASEGRGGSPVCRLYKRNGSLAAGDRKGRPYGVLRIRGTVRPGGRALQGEPPERAGEGTRPYGVIRTGSVGSAKPGAVLEPHQQQILFPQGPSGPGRKRTQALLILRAGSAARRNRSASPANGVRGKATMDTKCPSEPSPAILKVNCPEGAREGGLGHW